MHEVTKAIKSISDPQIRSSSFLGMNVGLDPVRNSSKSGLEPGEEDQDASKMLKVHKVTRSYKIMHAHVSLKQSHTEQ